MARAYESLHNDDADVQAQEITPSQQWSATVARTGAAPTALIIIAALLLVTISSNPAASSAPVRTMLSCAGLGSLDLCLKVQAFNKYEPGIKDVIAHPPPEKVVSLDEFLSASLNKCTCKLAGTCTVANNTIVTALVDIHRGKWDSKRKFETYTRALKDNFKLFPETAMVVFLQKGYGADVAAAHPGGATSQHLCLVEIELEDLPNYAYAKDWAKAMLANFNKYHFISWPQGVIPYYDVVVNSKAAMMGRAAQNNVFKSERFGWIDAGLHFPMTQHLPKGNDIDLMSCGDKVCIGFSLNPICFHDIWETTLKKSKANITMHCDGCMMGATWTGSRKAVMNMVHPFYDTLGEWFQEPAVGSDQGMMMNLYLQRPDLVKATPCRSFAYCSGYLLGAHQFKNASKYEWGNCDGEGGVQWLNEKVKEDPTAS